MGVLKKYDPIRVESGIVIKAVIKHVDHSSTQTFLNDLSKKLSLGLEPLFTFPVRWDKIRFRTDDYERKTFDVSFGEIDFTCNLESIAISRKFVDGADIFEYSLEFNKEPSKDTTDNLITEAYLNYKEEDENGKMKVVEFEVDMELLERVHQEQLDTSIF